MLIEGKTLDRVPRARSIITMASVHVIQENWKWGLGSEANKVARQFAFDEGLLIKELRRKDGAAFKIHGSLLILSAQVGIPAMLAFASGITLLILRSVRISGIRSNAVLLAAVPLMLMSQVGGNTFGKALFFLVLALLLVGSGRSSIEPVQRRFGLD